MVKVSRREGLINECVVNSRKESVNKKMCLRVMRVFHERFRGVWWLFHVCEFSSNFDSAVVGFKWIGVSGWSPLIERVFLDVWGVSVFRVLDSRGILNGSAVIGGWFWGVTRQFGVSNPLPSPQWKGNTFLVQAKPVKGGENV